MPSGAATELLAFVVIVLASGCGSGEPQPANPHAAPAINDVRSDGGGAAPEASVQVVDASPPMDASDDADARAEPDASVGTVGPERVMPGGHVRHVEAGVVEFSGSAHQSSCSSPRPAAHAPRTHTECMSVAGYEDPVVVERIVRANMQRFRHCYEAGLQRDARLSGSVDVLFVVARDGAVSRVSDAGSAMTDTSVVACVVRMFYGLSFSEPTAGVANLVYRFRFAPPPPRATR